ncbi:pentapeptide repeat-containing protein [Lentzea sp. CA-135723]|uniref:pentapeptide repeat-containing protein n=1 Tax=Lentzea sp. CA-135723 TaxID=3239950 RepID=UPI003D92A7E1
MTNAPVPRPDRAPETRLKPVAKRTLTAVVVGVVVVVGGLLTTVGLLMGSAAGQATIQLELIRIALTVLLGTGGLFGLYLAWRRQRAAEIALQQKERDQADVARAYDLQLRTATATERDAEARRITDLYTKAAEQLGSDKAPVRLAGLYALERLAQDHENQRQTIVNVLCAYLRMPYTLPDDLPTENPPAKTADLHREQVQEREVRLTAQRILTHHLRPGADPNNLAPTFWADVDLDLTEATLINLDLSHSATRTATFTSTCFTGTTQFVSAQFNANARFEGARFNARTEFDEVKFVGPVSFEKVQFASIVRFKGAKFDGPAWFNEARFASHAEFDEAQFADVAGFGDAKFNRPVGFSDVRFEDHAWFNKAWFADTARFSKATFAGSAQFLKVRFTGTAWFNETCFAGAADYGRANFDGEAEFMRAQFDGLAGFSNAQFAGKALFGGAQFNAHPWFTEVQFASGANFNQAQFGGGHVPGEIRPFTGSDHNVTPPQHPPPDHGSEW